jgi:hypothetical protein
MKVPGKLFSVLGATRMVSVLDVLDSEEEALETLRAS